MLRRLDCIRQHTSGTCDFQITLDANTNSRDLPPRKNDFRIPKQCVVVLRRAGLEEVRIHDLRHSFASRRWDLEKAWR